MSKFITDLDPTPSASLTQDIGWYIASEVIAAGQWVAYDNSKSDAARLQYVELLDIDGNANSFLGTGVALDAAAAVGDKIRVVTAGYCENAVVASSHPATAPLYASATAGTAAGESLTSKINLIRTDMIAIRTALVAFTAKLDADITLGGASETNYAATVDPAAPSSSALNTPDLAGPLGVALEGESGGTADVIVLPRTQ
jgi:sulfate adenylyltransferase subunit 1 (EFTu-like GTPase family)